MFFESFLKFQVFLQKKALRKQRSEDDDFIRKVKIDSARYVNSLWLAATKLY